ncbi:glycosyltransferase involved in cell wall biosynthesis [Chryseobacterium vietnamense]|uniref:glycosyltransferase family 4 protein n=1 Tax=Chryseobacterium vietnamense TaxID=866785 RepID=UPI0028557350|nr:glycosyltransferase family 4 protein [Chryseobacterium vietnamense]MDR6487554.1 glycosyltransferase involved in cell wall biosynthesis [Chryseobacterium vietnamense]
MKILMLCELYIESLEYQENLLVKYYRKHGHEVTVITSTYENVFDYYNNKHDNSLPAKVIYDHGAKIIKLPFKFNYLGKIKKYTSIKKIVEEVQPDLLYIHDIMPNMFEMLDYKKQNPHVKMIMDYHADYSNSANGWLSLNILHKVIRKYLYMDPIRKHISKFYPIVPGSTKFLNEVYNIPHNEMDLLPLGADTDLVAEIKNNRVRDEIRNKFGINNEDIIIFTGGKFTPAKKTDLLIKAFNEINDATLHLLIVGDADQHNQEYKKELLALSNNNPNIHYIGWLNNRGVYEYLSASDLAVFPASQSIVWQQALASGLPLIVGDVGEQSVQYLNEFGAITELKKEDINKEKIKKSIEDIIYREDELSLRKELALKTSSKYLDWNHLINKTLSHVKISN